MRRSNRYCDSILVFRLVARRYWAVLAKREVPRGLTPFSCKRWALQLPTFASRVRVGLFTQRFSLLVTQRWP